MRWWLTRFNPAAESWFMLLAVGLAGLARAGVYDDAAAWWHLDYDPNYNPAATNLVLLDEIRDQRDWGTTTTKGASGRHVTGLRGPLGGPLWTNAPVVCPAGGQRYGGLSLNFTQETNGLGQIWPDAAKVENFRMPGSSAIVTRFYWNGLAYNSSFPGWIYNNSLDWAGSNGWMFGVRGDGGNRLGMYVGQTSFYHSTTVVTGKWYDAAAVLTDNGLGNVDTVEFFLWPEDGTLTYSKFTTSVVTNKAGGSGGVIGSESFQDSYTSPTNTNSGKSFKGLLNHLAVWNRALSYDEVLEAFCYPQPLIQIGLNNGATGDLRIESEADAEYTFGAPWHSMRRAVTSSNRDATIKVPLTAIQAGLGYCFHVNTITPSDAYAKLSLTVNSVTNRTLVATAGAADLFWHVGPSQLVTGTNTFVLRYEGGSAAYTSFDWLELGGSWQIGTNNNSAAEFINEGQAGDHFYVTDPNWQHLERAVVQGSDSNTVLHFALSPEMLTKYPFTYTTRVVSQGNNTGTLPTPPFPFSIGVNGRILYQSDGVQNNTLVNIPFQPGDLRAGANDINLMFNSTNGWLQFDFHRLEVAPWPSGSLLFMR